MIKTFAQALMSAEADAICGAGYGQRSDERVNSRNGYRQRKWDTRAGTIDLAIPKLRQGSYFPDWLLTHRRRAGVDRFRAGHPVKVTDALFGLTPSSRDGSPSWIRVDDAHLIGDDVTPAVRDGVGIDRRSASAAANYLHTRQVLPAGTRFALRLVADTPTALHDATIRGADLSDPAGLVAWLTGAAPARPHPPAKDTSPQEVPHDGRLRVAVAWRPIGPLLVRDSLPGTVVATLPLTDTTADGTVRLLLPGSSIRGAAAQAPCPS